ncbi:hypothetical protein [Microbispora sp. GKU 823]|uniref:hypothetical protein n=1 Tax=Microbispora sp. GKU 823 TaxID=1652100 RepID=UPI00117F9F8E|nr:hypothetical protein [Microbispora sp. GKU 823]
MLRPPALTPAMVPNVWPDAHVPPSVQLSDSVATEPDASALRLRGLHSFTCAVWVLPGSRP